MDSNKRTGLGNDSYKILIVDDMATNRALVKAVLCPPVFEVKEAESGEQALDMIRDENFDVVILDILMPGLDGIEVCERIRSDLGKTLLPVIMVTSLDSPRDIRNSLEAGATDFVSKPFNNEELLARTKSAAMRQQLVEHLEAHQETLSVIARIIDNRDHDNQSVDRLAHIATVLGSEAGLSEPEIQDLHWGAILHDIGMICVPDEILLKSTPLLEHERKIIEQHTELGYKLCSSVRDLKPCLPIIHNHHERWDGSGYPEGLQGEAIPKIVRVFQIADVYHALTTDRPYRQAMSIDEVITEMEKGVFNGLWDPRLLSIFLNILHAEPEKFELNESNVPANIGARLFHDIQEIKHIH